MAWTALVGITLGIGRLLMPDDIGRSTLLREMVTVVGVLTLYSSLLAWPFVWSTLAPRRWAMWLVVASLCGVGLTWAEILTFQTVVGSNGDNHIFWIMNAMQAGAASVALLAMRTSGFRLIRISDQAM